MIAGKKSLLKRILVRLCKSRGKTEIAFESIFGPQAKIQKGMRLKIELCHITAGRIVSVFRSNGFRICQTALLSVFTASNRGSLIS